MDLGIRGRVAVVAAASKGLGRAVAEELAAEGVDLVLCARGDAALRATAEAIRQRSLAKVHTVQADVGKAGEPERVVREAIKKFGGVDILLTNSGGPPAGPFEAHSAEAWDSAYRLVLASVVEFCRAVLPGMKERRWGRILNMTSIAAKQPVDNLMLSNSIRAGVIGFARTLANEVAPFGITVNNLVPGFTKTERMVELAELNARKEGISVEEAQRRWGRILNVTSIAA
ncbi:MAG TPA: SDR family NAD(P)-dependent oxidoreductase, partial [Gemmatimonadales bacterium]|nr:SDR family NAD(P)-dependent oxidoreductase [Gemmatimonadales bacterium]